MVAARLGCFNVEIVAFFVDAGFVSIWLAEQHGFVGWIGPYAKSVAAAK
jgi:hypothetical protein